eukprot:TRINITY_DN14135_c1_g1_i1.p1 TRINITY_DN14135_c1_g1~~TRINITY_DN14135_c1_g1_i1.p1  ORF type:complete len:659 (+),score=148.70 TRINITY_DN14135_c1_g1_i1:74-2050(+)
MPAGGQRRRPPLTPLSAPGATSGGGGRQWYPQRDEWDKRIIAKGGNRPGRRLSEIPADVRDSARTARLRAARLELQHRRADRQDAPAAELRRRWCEAEDTRARLAGVLAADAVPDAALAELLQDSTEEADTLCQALLLHRRYTAAATSRRALLGRLARIAAAAPPPPPETGSAAVGGMLAAELTLLADQLRDATLAAAEVWVDVQSIPVAGETLDWSRRDVLADWAAEVDAAVGSNAAVRAALEAPLAGNPFLLPAAGAGRALPAAVAARAARVAEAAASVLSSGHFVRSTPPPPTVPRPAPDLPPVQGRRALPPRWEPPEPPDLASRASAALVRALHLSTRPSSAQRAAPTRSPPPAQRRGDRRRGQQRPANAPPEPRPTRTPVAPPQPRAAEGNGPTRSAPAAAPPAAPPAPPPATAPPAAAAAAVPAAAPAAPAAAPADPPAAAASEPAEGAADHDAAAAVRPSPLIAKKFLQHFGGGRRVSAGDQAMARRMGGITPEHRKQPLAALAVALRHGPGESPEGSQRAAAAVAALAGALGQTVPQRPAPPPGSPLGSPPGSPGSAAGNPAPGRPMPGLGPRPQGPAGVARKGRRRSLDASDRALPVLVRALAQDPQCARAAAALEGCLPALAQQLQAAGTSLLPKAAARWRLAVARAR